VSASAQTLWNAWQESAEVRELAEGWITKPQGQWTDDDERLYACFEKLPGRVLDPEFGLATIFAIMQMTDDRWTLCNLAAGPLEDFLGTHGEAYIDTIHTLALMHPRLGEVLKGVWEGRMSKEVWHRVEVLKAGA
jgi:hypothetical protein